MTDQEKTVDAAPPGARLDFRSGGWAIAAGLVLAAGAMALVLSRARTSTAADTIELTPCLVPREVLVKATSPEALPPRIDPPLLGPDEAQATRLPAHGKYLVPDDRVVGVALNGEACAYPVRVMHWHEAVDHTLGGVPIVVTYAALTDSARAFDRRVGDRTLELAASGWVWSSNPLLFDRQAPGSGRRSSLWSQLQGRAVAGPAASEGLALRPVPCELTTWSSWRARHPATKVIGPDLSRADRYRKDPYNAYAGNEVLRFPVAPMPPVEAGLPPKTPCVIVGPPGARVVYPVPWLLERAGAAASWVTSQAGVEVTFSTGDHPPHADVTLGAGASGWEVVYASWFGWYAQHPDDARLTDRP